MCLSLFEQIVTNMNCTFLYILMLGSTMLFTLLLTQVNCESKLWIRLAGFVSYLLGFQCNIIYEVQLWNVAWACLLTCSVSPFTNPPYVLSIQSLAWQAWSMNQNSYLQSKSVSIVEWLWPPFYLIKSSNHHCHSSYVYPHCAFESLVNHNYILQHFLSLNSLPSCFNRALWLVNSN